MNKKELVSRLAGKLGVSLRKADSTLSVVLDTIVEAVLEDGRCLCGGHKFKLHKTAERTGRNPNTGATLTIPAKSMVVYRKVIPAV